METRGKRIPVMQIVRHIVQIAGFILYPGLFATAFLSLGSIIQAAVAGTFTLTAMLPDLFIVAALFAITFLLGRFFCGFLCSFGAMGDLLWFISKHTIKPKFRISRKADSALKYVKYILLAAIILLDWVFGLFSFSGSASPWTAFAVLAVPTSWSLQIFSMFIPGLILLAAIMIASLFVERFFCRYLCPLGASFSLISKARIFRIRKTRRNCGNCSLCTAKCSMGIPLGDVDIVRSGECIDCFMCTDVCPKKNAVTDPQPLVTATLAVAATAGLVYTGDVFGNLLTQTTVTSEAASSDSTDSAASGTISGSSSASSGSTSSAAGSTSSSSDSASAETADSSSAAQDSSSAADTSSASGSSSDASQSSGQYTDGTYTGTGTGLRGTTEVSVTVENGVISSIEVVSYQDDSQYFNRAKSTVISEILDAQSVDVSTVSGATFSSNGIIEAVANALGVDFTNPNSSMQGGGRGH